MSDIIKGLPNDMPKVKFNLKAQEDFALNRGIKWTHWVAVPSPIGQKDKDEYRRSDSLDTLSENGFIYKKVGTFTGTIIGNGKKNYQSDGGIYDNSQARLVIPKFYDESDKEIALLPADRIYACDVDLKVDNYQKAEYNPTGDHDFLQFPVVSVSHLVDSKGIEYKQGIDFKITSDGNLKWGNKKTPGIDPETGKGRVYSIRYTYLAFYYIDQLINEVRVTQNESGEVERMPYHVGIVREYIYHNRTKPAKGDKKETITERTNKEPTKPVNPNKVDVIVDVNSFE